MWSRLWMPTAASSAVKGETLYDTGKMIDGYADLAVIRHARVGSSRELADGAGVPVINGGDGSGQHPTQALMDLMTIQKERGRLNNLTVTIAGDLKNSRTAHSLAWLLGKYGPRFYFVSPQEIGMPREITTALKNDYIEVVETSDLKAAAEKSDVLYMTRIQKERFTDEDLYQRLKGTYVVNTHLIEQSKARVLPSCILYRGWMKLIARWMTMKGLLIFARLPMAYRSAWQ